MIDSLISNLITIKETFFNLADFSLSLTDIVEILIITFLVYHILLWVKNTRAWNLFKGIMLILVFVLIAVLFEMNTILWIAERTLSVGLIALVVIFQPELRRALEDLGRRNLFGGLIKINTVETQKFSDKTITELIKASYEMGKVKTGALIVIENEVGLSEYERTGIEVDAIVTSQLLINIFEKNTPLHDGAVIVRKDRVTSATCYLPLSDNLDLSKELGTRHRAAVGISEVSDSCTIVVSEETGKVSIAMNKTLYRNVDADFLRSKLEFLQSGNAGNK
jgi:diadenylate cyclase